MQLNNPDNIQQEEETCGGFWLGSDQKMNKIYYLHDHSIGSFSNVLQINVTRWYLKQLTPHHFAHN